MSLRWKLVILLLILAVIPLIIAMGYTLNDLRSSGVNISTELRKELTESAEQHLSDLATSLAHEVHLDIEMIDLTLMTWSAAVVRQWENHESAKEVDAETNLYFAEDVRNNTVVPEDLTTDPRYFALEDNGTRTPHSITTKSPIFHIPSGSDRSSFEGDIRRLLGAFWTLRIATNVQVKLAHRYILALENGLYMNFPGNADLPADFNPTERPWYELGKISKGVSRTYPYIDAGTGQLVSSFTYPIRRSDGTLLGVVACDIVLTEFFDSLSIPPEWNHAASTMIVNPVNDKVMGDRLEIVATEDPAARFSDHPPMAKEPYHVDVENTPGLQEVIDQMRMNEEGTGVMALAEGDLLWSYAPMTKDGPYLLIEVPEAVVARKAKQIQSWLSDEVRRHAWRNIIFICLLIIVVVCLALICARSVTRPISNLVLVAQKVSAGDLDARADVRTSDEVGELGEVFNEMVPQLRDRMRIREALGVAMEVQQNLLPSAPPILDGFDIAGRSVYCDETGGDYYDFLELKEIGDGILGIAVGDVTGHGIAAALLMATARGALRARLAAPGSLADVMSQVNRRLAQDTQSGRFMTLFFLIIDKQLDEMRWVSAGHDPMLKFCPKSGRFEDLGGCDIPLGIDGQWSFTEAVESGWKSGEIYVIGTDGIWESRNSSGEMFGKDRLRELVRTNAEFSADKIAHEITEQLDQYRGDQHQEDDVTLVVIKVI